MHEGRGSDRTSTDSVAIVAHVYLIQSNVYPNNAPCTRQSQPVKLITLEGPYRHSLTTALTGAISKCCTLKVKVLVSSNPTNTSNTVQPTTPRCKGGATRAERGIQELPPQCKLGRNATSNSERRRGAPLWNVSELHRSVIMEELVLGLGGQPGGSPSRGPQF